MNSTQTTPVLASPSGELVFEPRVTEAILPQWVFSQRSHGRNVRDTLSLFVDIFELRAWARVNPVEGFLLAAYAALIAQPVVYGTLGTSIVSLMTPVK